ncbi:NAD(+)/NADH kinase [Methanogenium sp. MK-MG]|uniref:NAD(+)/NADH kinase n=1 Tax=Methanogenium sp. MK-MG TaxID=2599926 RepID=UPI0013ED5758|nr:NAD(+)/NADH kinase [Methanogenium sp. MK-MG]KAF1078425.1 Bifunctional NADP phosphatase/NAD kinase [Methanogenium sp. MK-MG]
MKIKIIPRPDDTRAVDYAREIGVKFLDDGHTIWFEEGNPLNESFHISPLNDSDADIAVVIGGDGSVLHAVQSMKPQVALVGINFGRVGFLADLESDEAYSFISQLKPDTIETESRMRIQISVDGKIYNCALNEAVIVTERPAKMLQFSVIVDGIPVEEFRSDGLIISTPTGSTAYAMSAGGPIVDPKIKGILLVPLAPFMLSSRPHIISSERNLSVQLDSDKPASLVIDGQYAGELHEKSLITVTESPEPALFIDVNKNFFTKVDRKLRTL